MSKSIYDPISIALGLEPIHIDFKELLTSGTLSHKGELNPFYGYIHTHESRQKMSETRIQRGCFKGEKNPMFGKTVRPWLGRNHTEESKKQMSISAKKRGSNRTGASHTEEQRQNIKTGLANRPLLKCPHCSLESRSNSNMARYHFDNCKKKPQ
jgi:hypothetical protein